MTSHNVKIGLYCELHCQFLPLPFLMGARTCCHLYDCPSVCKHNHTNSAKCDGALSPWLTVSSADNCKNSRIIRMAIQA